MEIKELIGPAIFFLSVIYCLFLLWCRWGWKKTLTNVPVFSGVTKISIVIAMRNEAEKITALLNSLVLQDYPFKLMEVIIVNDHSADHSKAIVTSFFQNHLQYNVKIIDADEAGKKKALSKGIKLAWHELILTTDADCVLPAKWISRTVAFYEKKNPTLIAMPVRISSDGTFTGNLQSIEMAGLNAIAGGSLANGSAMLCNGANLAFNRSAWLEVMEDKYSSYASGDDTDLLRKMKEKFPDRVYFFSDPSVVVTTQAVKGLADFFNQRQRWASKITGTMSGFTISIAVLAWLVHAGLLVQVCLIVFDGLPLNSILLTIFLKSLIESLIINPILKLSGDQRADMQVLISQPFYWFYITLTGISGIFFSYSWKGRKTK